MKVRFVELAKKAAWCSRHQFRMGAVITRRNRPVSVGCNKPFKTHPKSNNQWHSIHAELDAILSVPRELLFGSDIYVVRLTKGGQLAMSRPCTDCMILLREVGISKVFYSNNKRMIQEEHV